MNKYYSNLRYFAIIVIAFFFTLASVKDAKAWSHSDLPILQWRTDHLIDQINFSNTYGIATDSNDHIVTIGFITGEVTVLDSAYNLLNKFGHYGGDPGEFAFAERVIVDASGNYYVLDRENETVSKFASDGTYLFRFGTVGGGDGQFLTPKGIAADASGDIYVADTGNNRIQKFGSDGSFLLKFGSSGSSTGQFNAPNDVGVASDGSIFVVDTGNNRIQKFDNQGGFLLTWGTAGTGNGQFGSVQSIVITSADEIYTLENGSNSLNRRVQKFSQAGEYLSKFSSGTSAGYGLAVNSLGEVFISQTNVAGSIRKYSSSGAFIQNIPSLTSQTNVLKNPMSVSFDEEGNAYVADGTRSRIQKYNQAGQLVLQFGNAGFDEGELMFPFDAVTNSLGSIYVADDNLRVQEFDSAGQFVKVIGVNGGGYGEYLGVTSIAIDSEDNIFLADNYSNKILKYDKDGNLITEFGAPGSGNGQFLNLTDIAIDLADNLYTVDTSLNRVQMFNSDGQYINSPLSTLSFVFLLDVAVDDNGDIYILDNGQWQIQKYDSSANLLKAFGEYGFYTYEYLNPTSIAVHNDSIAILDEGLVPRLLRYEFDRLQPAITLGTPTSTIFASPSVSFYGSAVDLRSQITDFEYQLDSTAGSWQGCDVADGSFDELAEEFECQVAVADDGAHTVYIRSTDSYTNTNTIDNWIEFDFLVDRQGPQGSVTINSGASSTTSVNATLTLQATDVYSQVTQMMICNNSTFQNCVFEEYSTSKSWTLQPAGSTAIVYVQFKDALGNVSSTLSDSIAFISGTAVTPVPTLPAVSVTTTVTAAVMLTPTPTFPLQDLPETGEEGEISEIVLTILDNKGNPLQKAELEVDEQTYETDSLGKLTLLVAPGKYTVTIKHSGEVYGIDLLVTSAKNEYEVVVDVDNGTSWSIWAAFLVVGTLGYAYLRKKKAAN